MDYLRSREQKLRDTNESTNTRVKWFAFGTMFLLIGLGVWQVIYLRTYFRYAPILPLMGPLANSQPDPSISSRRDTFSLLYSYETLLCVRGLGGGVGALRVWWAKSYAFERVRCLQCIMDWKHRVVGIMSIVMFLGSMTISWKYQRQSFDLLTCDYD
jgi:hypothetical protein